MTLFNLALVFIGLGVLVAILGSLSALTEQKMRHKVRMSLSTRKKRKHLND